MLPHGRRALGPLMSLKPYLMAYPAVLAGAGLALVVSAVAMLVLPLAVRRMIDNGFSASDGQFIDRYFGMMILIGGVVATAAAFRAYFVNWLGERVVADLRRDVFGHLTSLGPAFFEKTHSGEVMSRLTADTTLLKSAAGSTISQALRNTIMLVGRARHDVRHQRLALGSRAAGHSRNRSAVDGLWPLGAETDAALAGHAGRSLGVRR